ncbi:XRE family transcriptional regulator [Mucilaginibacter sp.]|uniref:XRE family transcriptional regulator n=1 Tax=Mucilaginibacter sp. TaxID=1882438 RepID=UPI00284B89E3|nr:XRE family transcriptional regulator [Mucilaginibacter sp.]MDR3695095.1 XRE family transcriptional regulator [Mucilaginibacter sp.]
MAIIPFKISPSILKWARNSIGYSIEDTAHKLNINPQKLEEWEKGITSPTYNQLESLAYKIYKRPLATFFRKYPPNEKPIEKDFRNLTSAEVTNFSTEMILVIRKAKHLQNLITDLDLEEPKFKKFKVSIEDNPVIAAERFRTFIGLRIDDQKRWSSLNAFDNFKQCVENIGIFIFQLQMPFEEARAFSLSGDIPIIVLNTEDAKNGRIFSLFHEVCHILFNIGGVFRDKETNNLNKEYKIIEDFCNLFAASFLIPDNPFKVEIDYGNQTLHEWSEKDLIDLSKIYNVSKEAILRKLVDLNLASKSFYFEKKRIWNAELITYKDIQRQKNKESGGGIPQDIKVVSEKGRLFVSSVLENFEKGNISYGQISEFLEVKLDHLSKIIERINK